MRFRPFSLGVAALLLGTLPVNAQTANNYIRSTVGAPWGQASNESSMDSVFGAGQWSDLRYEAVITQDKLTITRVSGPAAAPDRSHELWIIAGDNPPVSLGVLPDDQGVISLPGAGPGEVLAITEEQAGGSPDGKPHGPIVAAGTLSAST